MARALPSTACARGVRLGARVAVLACAAALGGCGGDGDAPEPPALRISSPDVRDGGSLPRALTCDGEGAGPALEWTGVPEEAASLAVVTEDLDARGGHVHWTVWGLQAEVRSLVGEGPVEGRSSGGRRGWEPPCPPRGDPPHRYRFTVHALREPLELRPGAQPRAVLAAIGERSVASGELVARYGR